MTFSLFFDSIINNEEIIDKFIDIKKSANLDIIKCYKLFFSKEGLINNIGSYISLVILSLFLILSIIFCFKENNEIKNKIYEIIKIKKAKENILDINKKMKKKKKTKKKKGNKIFRKKKNKKKIKNKSINIMETDINNNNNINKQNFLPKKSKGKKRIQYNSLSNIDLRNNKDSMVSNFIQKNGIIKPNDNNKKEIIIDNKFTDYEINVMSYENALKNDKRTYFNYYFSLLRMKHLLIFSFYPNNDYNSKSIKIILFFFSFALYYTINALFFNDSTMHIIYVDNGVFNFIYQINQIIYSSLISFAITELIKYLSLTEKNVIKIKYEKNINNLDNIVINELNCIKIKFIIFFIISFLFLSFFWYYIGCFGAVYLNTQIYLIKDTLISFGFSLIYPLFLNALPGILRIPSLKNNNKECMYIISKFMQII